jgi:hypothetical protein
VCLWHCQWQASGEVAHGVLCWCCVLVCMFVCQGDQLSPEQYAACEELGILIDQDDQGILLQVGDSPTGQSPALPHACMSSQPSLLSSSPATGSKCWLPGLDLSGSTDVVLFTACLVLCEMLGEGWRPLLLAACCRFSPSRWATGPLFSSR